MSRIPVTIVSSKSVFNGKVVSLRQDEVIFPGGHKSMLEVVDHAGAVTVLPITAKGEVIMVKQYRYAVGEYLLELPAGTLNKGEDPKECAIRELGEETGYTAGGMQHLMTFYTTPGFSSEIMHLYKAGDLKYAGNENPDGDELINTVKMPLNKAMAMVANGEIHDAKTIIGILYAGKNAVR